MTTWLRRCASFAEEEAADREFWASTSPSARVAAVDDMRVAEAPGGSRDFEDLIACLNARGVRFLVVGGLAVAFHAKPRYTKDIDLLVEPIPANAVRLVAALADFGFGSLGLVPDDFTRPGGVVQLGHPPNRVDFLASITGVDFAEAWAGRVAGTYGAQAVHYIGRAELIRNKLAAGRPQDLVDVDWLRQE